MVKYTQINYLYEKGDINMCKCCCEAPDKLKRKPEECNAEQVEECHGEVQDHPCEEEAE